MAPPLSSKSVAQHKLKTIIQRHNMCLDQFSTLSSIMPSAVRYFDSLRKYVLAVTRAASILPIFKHINFASWWGRSSKCRFLQFSIFERGKLPTPQETAPLQSAAADSCLYFSFIFIACNDTYFVSNHRTDCRGMYYLSMQCLLLLFLSLCSHLHVSDFAALSLLKCNSLT